MKIGVRDRDELRTSSYNCKFVDVYYEDLIKNPVQTVKNVYKSCGKRCSHDYVQRLESYLRDDAERRKQQNLSGDKKRRHKYSLKDFSISEDDVEEAFASYCIKYKVFA